MGHNDVYYEKAKRLALQHYNRRVPAPIPPITLDDVFVVWFVKVLQNWKALVSTSVRGDSTYYEITYDGENEQAYVDCYTKVDSKTEVDSPHEIAEGRAEKLYQDFSRRLSIEGG
jgi:hypothetical protein